LHSDLRNILHLIGSPFVQFFGDLVEDEYDNRAIVYVGHDLARRFSGSKTEEGIVLSEAKGSGVSHIAEELKQEREVLTRMSVSLLQQTNYKTATQANDASSKSLGFLPFLVSNLDMSLNSAIKTKSLYDNKVIYKIEFNTKFDVVDYDNARLSFVIGLYDKGIITKETVLNIAKGAGIVSNKIDNVAEIRQAQIELQDAL
jgi:hypothetical protein